MPSSSFGASLATPKLNVAIDTGNPFLNVTVDGFLKIGTVAATKSLAEDAYYVIKGGNFSGRKIEHSLKKMCKEGAYWGTVAGMYVGMEYGMERIRGTHDWKNVMLGGALTGALISAASNKNKDNIVIDAIAGGAIATASTFLNYLI
ncbi:outer envelope pore protein 16, chloroplastic [Populus alba]|uniref:Mitochondrial import inner membrane translocase subunit Tim17/Tim22/Tim23 family protein n=1 Tax=Populus alba TaxID=43335 RepID=A0A4U5PVT3_POPAL|nr:outer envelope pore protein 16, chloroplastic [Populus alba]TKS01514.1 mitochondrial import inner membrane translocase subunit Tim17/Tim22/Tim23 family protein [Populus alba]